MISRIRDEELRRRVKALAGLGLRQQQICSIVGIRSPKTLRKRFGRELSVGVVEARAKIMHAAYKSAMSGRDPRMTMFWLKNRARWSDKAAPETELREECFRVHPYGWKLGVRKPQEPEPGKRENEDDTDEQ